MVITGLSGSGKSSLAFDIIYAEGQRRYIDSLYAYARQFLDRMARPNVDLLAGIPPTVAIEQRLSQGEKSALPPPPGAVPCLPVRPAAEIRFRPDHDELCGPWL